MFVHCHTIIQDAVLKYKIQKYISRTPFLTLEIEPDEPLKAVRPISSETDLIILEATHLSLRSLGELQQKFINHYFLILTDLLIFSHLHKTIRTVVYSKNFSYSDFIEGLCFLASDRSECKDEV